jgi:hypothetical protein
MFEETELDITAALASHRNTTMYKCVARLVRMGATKVTVRNNPHFNKNNWAVGDFFIFTGYAEDKK